MVLPFIAAAGAGLSGAAALKSAIGGNKSSTSSQPWSPARDPLKAILGNAENMYQRGDFKTDPYNGQRVSPHSAMTQQGIGMLGNMQGMTPQVSGAYNEMLDGGGMYRDFDAIRGRVQDQTSAGLASMFAGGGINSGLAQDTASRAMSESLAGVEYGAWGDQQQRRLQALGMAPDMQNLDLRAAGARITGGGLQDDLAQRKINANMQRHYEGQDAPMNALMRYSGLVQGIGGMGGQTQSHSPTSLTDWGNMFSGAGTAMTAASTLFGNKQPTSSGVAGQGVY